MKYRITTWLAAALMLSSLHATAASLSDIQVSNGDQQARITLALSVNRSTLYPTGQTTGGAGYQTDRRIAGTTAAV
jgi:hypothetical protein